MATSLENLKSCKAATDKVMSTINTNTAIAKFNSDQSKAAGAAHDVWANRKREFEDKLNRWSNRSGEYDVYRLNRENRSRDRKETGEGVNPQNHWCTNDFGNGWEVDGRLVNVFNVGRMSCRKTQAQLDLEEQDYRNAKPSFTEPEPKDNQGSYAHQTPVQNDTVIQCCANILNMKGEATNVVQSCHTALETQIKNALNPPTPKNNMSNPVKNTANSKLTNTNNTNNTRNIILMIFICIIFILSVSSSILVPTTGLLIM